MDKLVKLNGKDGNFQLYFFIIVFVGAILLAYFVLKPFIYPFILAIIFAALFRPFYLKLLGFFNQKKSLSAFIAVGLILLLILIPLTFIGIKISLEAGDLYSNLSSNGGIFLNNVKVFSQDFFQKTFSFFHFDYQTKILNADLTDYLRQGANWLLQNLKSVFSSLSLFVFKGVIFLAMLFYLFKYGDHIKNAVIALSPLPNNEDEKIFHRLNIAIHSILRGSIVIALIQGILVGIGFAIFGVPQPTLWGSVAALAALIPSVGTTIILVPAIIFLWFSAGLWPALGLLLWGIVIVGLVDNFLAPILISRNSKIHPFVILLSVLGGIVFFGPIGFVLGPLALSLVFTFFEIYFQRAKI